MDALTLDVRAEVPVGDEPRTLAISPDGRHAFVANRTGGSVSVVDLRQEQEVARWLVGAMPYGVVTDGATVYVSEFPLGDVVAIDVATGAQVARTNVGDFPSGMALGDDLLVSHLFSGRLSRMRTGDLAVSDTVGTGSGSNLSQFVALSGGKAYLPQTRSNSTETSLVFDSTVFPVVNVVDLATLSLVRGERVTLDTADRPVSVPFAVAFSPDALSSTW